MESRMRQTSKENKHPQEAPAEGTCRLNPGDRKREWEKHGSANWGIGPARDIDAILRFNDAVMNWIAEATTLLYHDHSTCDGARTIISDAADRCWGEYGLDNTVHSHTTPAKRCATQPRNGAGYTPASHPTPGECSKQRDGTSGPVAWWVKGCEYDTGCEYEFVALLKEQAELAATNGGKAVPLYRSPTLTDAEREAVEIAVEYVGSAFQVEHHAAVLRGLLERLR